MSSVRPRIEGESKGIEGAGRPHPAEAVGAQIHLRAEMAAIGLAQQRVQTIGQHDQIGLVSSRQGCQFLLERQLDAQSRGAFLQQHQQSFTRTAAKAVAADAESLAPDLDSDVIPIGKGLGDRLVALAVGLFEIVQRLVGKDHAEAESVIGLVALDHMDIGLREGFFDKNGEIEPGRSATDDFNPHDTLHR